MFVYDTESHENWEDYKFNKSDFCPPDGRQYGINLWFDEVPHKVTCYTRAVAYCYDFKRPFQDYEDGYYQSKEFTFYVDL